MTDVKLLANYVIACLIVPIASGCLMPDSKLVEDSTETAGAREGQGGGGASAKSTKAGRGGSSNGGSASSSEAGAAAHAASQADNPVRTSDGGHGGEGARNGGTGGRAPAVGNGQAMGGGAGPSPQGGTGAGAAGKGATQPTTAGASRAAGDGACGNSSATDGRPTIGPLACIVEQHNAVRAMVKSASALPPLTWSAEIAKYAQEWADMTCMKPMHRMSPSLSGRRLGENLYASGGGADPAPGKNAVDGWSGELDCYTFGAFMTSDKCDMQCASNKYSDGCGHYTQVVWRNSTELGCGVATCGSGTNTRTEVICDYSEAGNVVGMTPY